MHITISIHTNIDVNINTYSTAPHTAASPWGRRGPECSGRALNYGIL